MKKSNALQNIAMIFVMFAFLFNGCSEKGKKDQRTEKQQSQTESADSEYQSEDHKGDIADLGTPCKKHRYALSPNTGATLTFEMKLKKEALMIELFDLAEYTKRVNVDDIKIDESDVKGGVECDIESVAFDSVTVPTHFWGMDGSELIEAHKSSYDSAMAAQQKEGIAMVEPYGNIKGVGDWKAFIADEFGIITRFGNYTSVEAISALSEEEMMEKLDGNLNLEYFDPVTKKDYSLPIAMINGEKELYFATISINISVPDRMTHLAVAKNLYFKSDVVDESCRIRIEYNEGENIFIIEGPAYNTDCYEADEY